MMSQDLPDAQSDLPSGTVNASPQAFPQPTRVPLNRAGGRWHGKGSPVPRLPDGPASLDRICLRHDDDYVLVPIRSILVARSDSGTTTVDLDGQALPVRCSLDRLEAALVPFGFFRSHRAFLVNLRRVRRIVPWSRHVHHLLLDDPKETMVPLAKARRHAGGGETMTFLDLYREKYERRGGTAGRFVEAYLQADPEAVVDYLLHHHPEGVQGALIVAAMAFRDTGRTHSTALVTLLQEGRAAMTYERLAEDLPELPEPFAGEQGYDVDWAVDRRDLLNWVK